MWRGKLSWSLIGFCLITVRFPASTFEGQFKRFEMFSYHSCLILAFSLRRVALSEARSRTELSFNGPNMVLSKLKNSFMFVSA